jgi:hypothetical protein
VVERLEVLEMKLKQDWQQVARKAWSIRLGVLAGLFSGAEVILPLFADVVPRNTFAALSFIAVVGAVIARLVAQPNANL